MGSELSRRCCTHPNLYNVFQLLRNGKVFRTLHVGRFRDPEQFPRAVADELRAVYARICGAAAAAVARPPHVHIRTAVQYHRGPCGVLCVVFNERTGETTG